jgi:enediyne biosynthesis protein E4
MSTLTAPLNAAPDLITQPAVTRDSWPSIRDPRYPFAAILTLYGVLGFTVFGFNRTPWQMLGIVTAGMALEVILARAVQRRWVVPLSAYISCCSLALLLNYSHHSPLLLLPVALTIGSKYALTFEGKHIFNPSMFGVAVSLLVFGDLITAAPAYQWAGGDVTMSAFIIMSALTLFVFRIRKNWLILSFLLFYALQTGLRAWILRHHIPAEMMFWGTITAPAFFIFTFYMITDPATSPKTPKGQVAFALALTLVDLYLHVWQSVFTFFYAALAMGTGKYLFLHARALWRARRAPSGLTGHVRQWLSPPQRRAAVAVTCLAAITGTLYAAYIAKPRYEPGFSMTRVSPEHSGLGSPMGDVLERVDPRLLHVSKWILSVGSAAAVADVNNDGLLDVFLTQPLHADGSRAMLMLNQGDLRFSRHPMPALEPYQSSYATHGMPGGATFVDWDGDGDQDLALAVAFGPSQLFENRLIPDGALSFINITERAGLGDHHVSLSISFLDFNRDAHLDIFVANALTTHLPDYDPPAPLNIFNLPAAAYDGDRRALRFMHNGWHSADNGGLNHLYIHDPNTQNHWARSPIDLPETRWSLATCTLDINHDGFTDLYVANDFGPDRLYLNDHGQRLVSIIGPQYGDIGKDTYKGMNCSSADFDRNGYADIYISNVHHPLQAEGSILWMVGPPADPSAALPLPSLRDEATTRDALNERRFGWGAAAGDLNNDGWPDIVQANGMVGDRLDPRGYARKDYWYVNHKLMQSGPDQHTYADMWGDIRGRTIFPDEARRAYFNLGADSPGYFADAAQTLGVADPNTSRGVVMADLDNDGDLDLLITNQHAPPDLYRSDLRQRRPSDSHFIGLTLLGNGSQTHPSALGSRVAVTTPAGTQWAESSSLSGFSAQSDPRLHFGLADYTGPVEVEVYWLGAPSSRHTLTADSYHVIQQPPSHPAPI